MKIKNTSYKNIAVWWQFAERSACAFISLRTPKPLFLFPKIINYEQIRRNSN